MTEHATESSSNATRNDSTMEDGTEAVATAWVFMKRYTTMANALLSSKPPERARASTALSRNGNPGF